MILSLCLDVCMVTREDQLPLSVTVCSYISIGSFFEWHIHRVHNSHLGSACIKGRSCMIYPLADRVSYNN